MCSLDRFGVEIDNTCSINDGQAGASVREVGKLSNTFAFPDGGVFGVGKWTVSLVADSRQVIGIPTELLILLGHSAMGGGGMSKDSPRTVDVLT